MAEILSREKELFKINQELNLMSLGPSDEQQTPVVSQSRYGTYLKQKGPSTLLKKKLNGEGAATNNRPASGRSQKIKCQVKPMNRSPGTSPSTTPQSPTPRGKTTQTLMTQLTKSKLPERRQGGEWKSGKGQHKYATAQPTSRLDSSLTRRSVHKTATYVKYRNPNFTQSPSLDLLLRKDNENANNLQHMQQQPQQLVELEVTQQTRESTTVVNGQSKKHLTQDNFIRFLKAKVVILEEDHGALTQEMSVQRERLDETMEALRKAESQRDQVMTSNSKLSEQLQRFEQQSEEAARRQKERQLEFTNLQREMELLKRDNKVLKQTNTNLENRLSRANDEAESTRQMLSQQNGDKREEQETQRKELKIRDNRIKSLKRQRADLLNAYKKQLFMIDNLKRQNTCVEQAVAIGFGEKEFNKVLEWNMCSKSTF
ncbi:hypothetical protein KR093_007901 [Drosophila rubida]|uniref:Testis-expressed sequence 9 protein n=1 Tax=Drosophila rubida TaxID=30044 RepID=A0AAD4K385_9MUSC|nr:hypothetical protein KR093_007901 [Drosophila rubida]